MALLRSFSILLGVSSLLVPACSGTSPSPTDSGSGGSTSGDLGSGGALNGQGGEGPGEGDVDPPSEPVSDFIVVDQFGYLPDVEKIAVVRDPQTGFDADLSFAPGASYQLIDASTKAVVLEAAPAAYQAGAVHDQSGDKTWWFDFSTITKPGVYYLLDPTNSVRSDLFRISSDVYRDVLKHAVRSFLYQRAGFAKTAEFAGASWADGASHVAPLQDKNARLYNDSGNADTERDLSGGWYDAGDYNKYTAWTGDYVSLMLRAYQEKPGAFGDDYGLTDSGNGVADIVDEARFGLEHLARLQEPSGGVLSIVGLAGASPPSSATDPSVYGPASTNATIRAALAYSAGARVFAAIDADFSASLKTRAEDAWDWATANPALTFFNNDSTRGTQGVGAGQQEISPTDLALFKNCLAVELYRLTGTAKYKTFFEANYDKDEYGPLNGYVAAWQIYFHDYYLDYVMLSDATPTVKAAIVAGFNGGMANADNFGFLASEPDPYMAYVSNGNYTWGSNAHKSGKGSLFYEYVVYDLDASKAADARRAAQRYVHYLHGVNPLGLVYLSNMGGAGAHRSVSQFYHTWFGEGTDWDEVGVNTYGPPPGYLVGGPNPSYNWDDCCDANTCPDAGCGAAPLAPPHGQPAQKSYLEFNDSWPLNSWEVTENSNGYQLAYIRLLSKFVN